MTTPSAGFDCDDGGVLVELDGPDALSWRKAYYVWPSAPDPLMANQLTIPLQDKMERRSGIESIRNMVDFKFGYTELPGLYSSAISTRVIERVKQQSGGTFFHSLNPDVYSAIAIASVVDTFYRSNRPLTLAGTSHNSIGMSYIAGGDKAAPARQFFEEENIPIYPGYVRVSSMPVAEAEAFLQAARHFPALREIPFSVERVLSQAIRGAVGISAALHQEFSTAIRTTAEMQGLSREVEAWLARFPNVPGEWKFRPSGYLPLRQTLRVNASDYGVRDVAGAAQLCANLLDSSDQFRSVKSILRTLGGYASQLPSRRHWIFAQLRARALGRST